MTAHEMSDAVELWGLIVLGSAAVFEAVLVVQRRLAASRGWQRWPTMSMVFRDDGKQWLIFPFGWGVLGGHWWGPWPRMWGWDVIVFVGSIAAVLARDIVNRWHPKPLAKAWTFLALVFGALVGALFWSSGS